MNSLEGKVALITGGVSGIGLATAHEFARAGARLVIADVADGSALANELSADFVHVDVTDPASVSAMFDAVIERHSRLDILFNNAGIERHASLVDMDFEEHRRVIDVDLNGAYYVLQGAIRQMLKNEGPQRGSIVNTASVAGLWGAPGLSSYNCAKGGLVLLTKNAALEVGAQGIRVNAVCPGIIRTPMAEAFQHGPLAEVSLDDIGTAAHPLRRIGEPEDVAKVVTFLASDDAAFVTGAAIPVDGGMTAGTQPFFTE